MSDLTQRLAGAKSSLAFKAPCRVATTANITLSGYQTVDGVLPTASEHVDLRRILVKSQTAGAENGIYTMDTGAWVRTRDFDSVNDIREGTRMYVFSGTVGAGAYVITSDVDPDAFVMDTTSITITAATISDLSSTLTTRGDLLRRGTSAIERLPIGTAGYLLGSDGTDTAWAGFLQAGSGAVTRTWQSKMREASLSVVDFGAVGDDSTDNATAFTNAIAAADSANCAVFIPAGTYRVSSALSLPQGVALIGEAREVVTIKTTSATANIFETAGYGVSISRMKFASSVTRTAGSFVNVGNGIFELSDFSMTGAFKGVNLASAERTILIENGEILDAVPTTGVSIDISNNAGTDVSIRDVVCTISNLSNRPLAHLRLKHLGDLSIADCQLYGAEHNCLINPGNSESVGSLKAVNVWFDGAGTTCLLINPSGTGTFRRSSFSTCWFATSGGSAVSIFPAAGTTDVDGIDWVGCEFYDAIYGFFTGGSSSVIKNCQVLGGRFADATTAAVVLDDVASFSLIGVKLGESGGFGANAIGIVLGNDADNIVVSSCDFRGSTTTVSGSSTGTNIRFIDNLGYDAVLSPSQITSNQNDYAPTGLHFANTLRLSTDASRNLTGIAAPGWGKRLVVENTGSFGLVIKDDDGATSTAANRFALNGDITLLADESAVFQYDTTTARWRLVSVGYAAAPAAASFLTLGTDTKLTSERVLTPGAGLTGTDGGAGSTYTLAVGAGTGITANGDDVAVTMPAGGSAVGLALLTSGTVSSAATLDIVLTSYTGYRGIVVELYGFLPATDATELYLRFSTDGGSTYDATGYNYNGYRSNDAASTNFGSGSASEINCTSGGSIGNASNEGLDGTFKIMNQTSSAFWTKARWKIYGIDSQATPSGAFMTGGGSREAAQDTNAIRFLFSSGNIAAGGYAVYGLA